MDGALGEAKLWSTETKNMRLNSREICWVGTTVRILISASLLFGLAYPLWAQGIDTPEAHLRQAVQLHQAGDLAGAIQHYESYLASGQPHPEILSNLGAAYVGVGDYEKAIGVYQRALQLQPGSTQIHFNLGLALYKANLMDGARDEFLRVLGAEPTNTRAAILLADIYFRFGENGMVVQTLEPFRAQAVSNPAISYLLGTALIRENRVAEGQVFINEITRQGDSAAGHMMMGTAHMMAGEFEQATNEFREAILRDPKLPGVHSTLGSVLFSLNKPEEARSAFQNELENNPNDFEANFYLASLLHEDQRFKRIHYSYKP